MKKTAFAAVLIALVAVGAATAALPNVTYRLKIPAKIARGFAREARIEGRSYGYPVHGCAFTHASKIYGCSVSAPGDWQLLTRPGRHLYYEYIVQSNRITKRLRYTP